MNNLERKSTDIVGSQNEYMTGDRFYKKMLDAIQGKEGIDFNKQMWSFPNYLTLPKGSVDGMRFKLFFYIGSCEGGKLIELPLFGKRLYYGKPFNFPIDRPMYPWFFNLGNVYFKDVFIYHQTNQEMMGYHSMNTMRNSMQDSMYILKSNSMQDSMQDYGNVIRMNRERYMNMMQDIKKSSMMDYKPEQKDMTMKTDYTMGRMRDLNMMHI